MIEHAPNNIPTVSPDIDVFGFIGKYQCVNREVAFYQVSKLGIWEVFHVRYNIEQILISSDVRIEILEIKVAFTRNPKKRLMDQTRESGSKRTLVFHTSANGGLTSMRSHTHPSTTVLNKEHGTWETFDGLKTNIAH